MAHADTDYRQPARRRIGAQLLIRNPAGHVLLVQPSYKPGWILVGGGAHPEEPPHLAAQREGIEETGQTDLVPRDLLLLDYVPGEPGVSAEGYNFVFDGGILPDNTQIILPTPQGDAAPELLDWQFTPPDRLADVCRPYQRARIIQALAALHDPTLRGYTVLGQRVPPA
ncbi:NUDIX domain-containing protein [Streptomyces griseorubiginosus]|uniref:NUDIX domain-containing protein n=1 Tax=Streptomyces griseorubiginosus TaxID=67304 RepID=UPI0036E301D4